ncbi:Down syndrome cell adhesion molecule-like protein 1 homolog isoform X2 [Alosa alosa]|uniref:Down syndrome cell adhesion molecule-like protein 1 homolog isoform X2 n=1 Tax=Alosa alosa TaxID=278164 RepID=UPI0020152B50|nr:Down syndrome cell adhesion molecule-like protein 1 homolog isoform X2 [Alosa alosa]XP_048094180.1 Down syndrome cell adhesion molecule-like protein 1 homolog isoform X2 [Alosa alosa]
MAKRVHLQCLGLYAILLHFSSGDKVVSINTPLGENVTLHCNTSGMYITKNKWSKDGIQVFLYSPVLEDNKYKTNFTSERMSVDPSTLVLHISDVQVSDVGIYTCEVTGSQAQRTETWNLTITSVSPDPSQLIYISTAAISGTILIIICSILCIYSSKFSNLYKPAIREAEDVLTEVFFSATQQGTIRSEAPLDV